MARKSMPATRKRKSPTRKEQHQEEDMEMHASAQHEAQKLSDALHTATSLAPSLPCDAHITPHPDSTPALASSSQPLHAHGKKRPAPGETQSMKKWLHAFKHKLAKDDGFWSKQIEEARKLLNMAGTFQKGSVLESLYECDWNKPAKDDSFLSKQIEEVRKVLNVAGSLQKSSVLSLPYECDCNKLSKDNNHLSKQIEEVRNILNVAATGSVLASLYECDHNLLFGSKKFANVPDLIGSLTSLRTWMEDMWPTEYSLSLFLDKIKSVNTPRAFSKQNRMEPNILTDLEDLFMLTPQCEIFETLLSQQVNELVERSNFGMRLCAPQHPALNVLLNELVCRSVPICEKNKTCVGSVPEEASILRQSVPICEKKKKKKKTCVGSGLTEAPIVCQSVPICEKQQPCTGNASRDAPIVCRSVPICEMKKTCTGNASMEAANLLCSTNKGTFVGQEEDITKSNKHKKARTRTGADLMQPGGVDLWTTHQISHGELESWIVKHSMPSKERIHSVMKKPNNSKISEDFCAENGEDRQIEIEVELSGRSFSFLENEAAAAEYTSNMPHVKHILKTISLNRVDLDGQDEVLVLFKALRSDDKEIIVDNAYLRSTYPLLLVNFYEQNLHFLGGNLLAHGTQ